jgi:ankyrin repeat protein
MSDPVPSPEDIKDFHCAVVLADMAVLDGYVEKYGAAILNAPLGGTGLTPLTSATLVSNDTMVKLLLRLGADVDGQDTKGKTPLHWAALVGSNKIATLLLEKGAATDVQNEDGKTAWMLAQDQGYDAVVATIANFSEKKKALCGIDLAQTRQAQLKALRPSKPALRRVP